MAPHQDTPTRSRPITGEDGPSDSALAAARGGRLRRPAADRHAARCASRALCSGGAPRRYSPSIEARYGIVYQSKQSYYDLLEASGLSYHRTEKGNPNRNEGQVLERREEIKKTGTALGRD